MKKPVLVIMAAGMGSRYGGLKQIDPVDQEGHIIMDFSIYDAKRAGFEKVVFIIKKENEADFKEAVGNRIGKVMQVAYVYQELSNIPEGCHFCTRCAYADEKCRKSAPPPVEAAPGHIVRCWKYTEKERRA